MNLTCPSCSAPIGVDLSRVPADGFTVRCPECAHSFLYFPPKEASAPPPVSDSAGRIGGPSALDIRYFIKRPTGKIFGPFDSNAIRTMLDAGKLSVDAEVSPDQTDWEALADVDVFADLVRQITSRDSAPALNQGFGRPTPGGTMLGAWVDTAEESEADDGPELPSASPPQLPRPKSSLGGLELPKPKSRIPDLPKPRGAKGSDASLPGSTQSGGPQLPKRRALNLPTPRAGLPKSAGADSGPPELPGIAPNLPAPTGGLPQRKGVEDLPQTRANELPGMRLDDSLPQTRANELPRSADDQNLPASPSVEDELFGDPAPGDDLFGDAGHDDDLFGDPGHDDLFGDPGQDDDLFGDPAPNDDLFGDAGHDDGLFGDPAPNDDLFGGSDQGDDLFGDPAPQDDLFGAPDDADDLFDAPEDRGHDGFSNQGASFEEDAADFDMDGARSASSFDDAPQMPLGGGDSDDLFDAPGIDEDEDDLFAAPGFAEEDEDLFDAPDLHLDDASGAEDDFLSDDNNFTFLDEPSHSQPDDLAGMSGEWGDDLMSDAPVMDAFDSGRHDDTEDWEQDDWDPSPASSTPAGAPSSAAQASATQAPSPESTASRQPASRGIAAQTSREEVVDADKKRGPMALIGVSLLGVALAGGLAYAAYTHFSSAEVEPVEQAVVKKAAPTRVDLSRIQSDTYGDLRAFIDSARKGEISKADTPKLLLAESLLLSRYVDADIRKHAETLAKPLVDASSGWEALARGAFEAQNANADAARSYLEPLLGEDEELAYYAQLLMGIGDALAAQKQLADTGTTPAVAKTPDEDAQATKDADASDEAAQAEASQDQEEQGEDAPKAAPNATAQKSTSPSNEAAKRIATRGISALEAAQKLRPDAPAPSYWRATLLALNGQPDAAIKAWESALESSESHVASSERLGELFYARGDLNSASARLEHINDKFEPLASPGERASALHLQGMIHSARQQSDEAIKALTTALSIDVDRGETIQALAEEYMAAEKYQEALNFFTTNKNLGAENPDVMLGIVRAYMGMEKWDNATEQLQRGAKLFPEDARFPLYLGRLHRDRLAYFDAKKALEQALKIDASLLSAHAALAQLIWITDKDQEAAEAHIKAVEAEPTRINAAVGTEVAKYYQMSKQRDLAEARYAQTLEQHPNYWPARLELARMYLDAQENEKALTLLERAKAEGVKDLRLSAYLADAYRQSRHFAKAVDQINLVIAEHNDNPQYIFIRGRIYFDQGNFDNAREDFIKAYELDVRFHQAYFYLGRTAFAQQDYTKAMKIFRHVLDYKPNNGEFHYWMGRSYEAEKRLTSALDEYRKATVVDEEFAQKNPALYVRRGELLSKLGYSKKGKEDIATALRLAPDMVEALVAMGHSNYRDKLYEEAIGDFQSALKLDPKLAEVQYKLGMALMYTNKEVKGAEHLQLAVRYGYEDPDIFQTLGYLYKRMNRRREAIDAFKKYLTLVADKQSVTAKTKRDMMQEIKDLGGKL